MCFNGQWEPLRHSLVRKQPHSNCHFRKEVWTDSVNERQQDREIKRDRDFNLVLDITADAIKVGSQSKKTDAIRWVLSYVSQHSDEEWRLFFQTLFPEASGLSLRSQALTTFRITSSHSLTKGDEETALHSMSFPFTDLQRLPNHLQALSLYFLARCNTFRFMWTEASLFA